MSTLRKNTLQRKRPSDTMSRAFATQYTSVVLIILTFVLGAFTPPAEEVSELSVDKQDPAQPAAVNIGGLGYSDLLIGSTDMVNAAKAEALVEVIKNHDLTLTIEIADNLSGGTAFARTASLTQFFLRAGLSPNEVRIFASDRKDLTSRVTFRTELLQTEGVL